MIWYDILIKDQGGPSLVQHNTVFTIVKRVQRAKEGPRGGSGGSKCTKQRYETAASGCNG